MPICTLCLKNKPIEQFSWKIKKIGERHKRCKSCVSISVKKHYLQSRDKYLRKARKNNKIYAQRNVMFVVDILKKSSCIDCGETNIIVLDFDHVRGDKIFNIAVLRRSACSLKFIKKEIDKCVVRCANCHRIKTAKERGYYKYLAV